MNKKVKKLTLNSETLRNLEPDLRKVAGGTGDQSEAGTYCSQACTGCTQACTACTKGCTGCTRACSACC
jgi:hypothetical protein